MQSPVPILALSLLAVLAAVPARAAAQILPKLLQPPPPPTVDVNDGNCSLLLWAGSKRLPVSLHCPRIELHIDLLAADTATSPVSHTNIFGGDRPSQTPEPGKDAKPHWVCGYQPIVVPLSSTNTVTLDRELHAEWSPQERVLRKWLRFRITNAHPRCSVTLREITLETITSPILSHDFRPAPPQSYPLFLDSFFAGIEFPVASTRVEANLAILAHRPLSKLDPGVWHESRRAVYGPAISGGEVLAFHQYIEAHRPAPKGMHFNYNSWWTSPVPFSESDILRLMKHFQENLFNKHGVALDSFTIDMGWSDPNGVWDIDKNLFPEGFARIRKGAEAMGGRLGLWCSPSSHYPPAVNPQWALDHGYESFQPAGTQTRLLSLAGEKYRAKYASSIAAMVKQSDLGQVKLDGLYLGGAGFMAGAWPSEATAAGAVEAFDAMQTAGSNVWLEATYSAYASPWWLFHVNSVIGGFGDDSPHGRVPAPVYRDSYTTARDYYNLQSADRLPSPIPAQEILGIIHQSDDSFLNDAVTTILRGHAFISLYINPKFMNDQRWAMLAGLIKWARAHAEHLTAPSTFPLRPPTWLRDGIPWLSHTAPMPREPYGYAHWSDDGGLVLLRNPWAAKQSYPLRIDLPAAKGPIHAVSVYPETRLYLESALPGQTVDIPVAPYETIVLSFARGAVSKGLPRPADMTSHPLQDAASSSRTAAHRVVYDTLEPPLGLDYTSRTPASGSIIETRTSLRLNPVASNTRVRLLALFEGPSVPEADGTLLVGGRELPLRSLRADAGFVASGAPAPEFWHFLEGELPETGGDVSLRLAAEGPETLLSLWLLTDKAGAGPAPSATALPSPERVSLDGACLLKPATLAAMAGGVSRQSPPLIDRLHGVFLDCVAPVSVQQGWNTLKTNRSVWDKPMIIGAKRFRRGLGTHASSDIVYNLRRKYRRFQAWAGPDMATSGTMGFTVLVDGKKAWESGRMVRGDAPRECDIDVTGADQLRLVVDDAGDGIMGDHADWADARLLY